MQRPPLSWQALAGTLAAGAALAAYAVLRCCGLIRAGDWRVPNRIARVTAEMNGETP